MAMLFVSHDLAVVRSISDDVVVMRDGVVREAGAAAGLFAAPQDDYTRELLAAVPRLRAGDYPGGDRGPRAHAELPPTRRTRCASVTVTGTVARAPSVPTGSARRQGGAGDAGLLARPGQPDGGGARRLVGLDWLIIESDHYGTDSARRAGAADGDRTHRRGAAGARPAARPQRDRKALDIGALGVVVPMVGGAEEAAAVVAATRYPPAARALRADAGQPYYLDDRAYLEGPRASCWCGSSSRRAARCATSSGWPRSASTASSSGPATCRWRTASTRWPTTARWPTVAARALEVGRRTGLAVGINVATPEQQLARRAEGYTMIDGGPEYQYIAGRPAGAGHAFAEDATA